MHSLLALLLHISYAASGGGGGSTLAERQRGHLIFALLVVFILGYSLYEWRVLRKRR